MVFPLFFVKRAGTDRSQAFVKQRLKPIGLLPLNDERLA